ncbi:hypothetical protein JCM8208_007421 [Rhodotorula glutinis]
MQPAREGLAFSLSRLLADKMARSSFASSLQDSTIQVDQHRYDEPARPAWLVQRCPATTMARLDADGGCFCGKLDQGASLCDGNDLNDRRAVCIEDLRDDDERDAAILERLVEEGYKVDDWPTAREGERGERSRKRRATCGLEYREGFELEASPCPFGYARVGGDDGVPPICQHTASPYSCGREQRDCFARPGILQAQCTDDGECEILVCKEGWRFHFDDSAAVDGSSASSCVPSKPLFYSPAT